MKRFLILLLCLALLAGCRTDPQIPASPETDPMPTTEAATSPEATLPEEQPGVPLLDQGEASGKTGNLLYIPNPHVEFMACPEIRLYENSLLLYEHAANGRLQIKRISLEDGTLLAEASYPMNAPARVQVGNGLIGVCDSDSRQVLILNESLEVERRYTVPLEGESWYLNQELETVYVFFEEGLTAYDLEADRAYWLLDNATLVQPFEMGSGYVLFSYTDLTDRKTYNRCLNLSTATIETIPVEAPISSGVRNAEQWLLRQDIASGTYILVNREKAVSFTRLEGLVELLPGKRQLLLTDGSYRDLSLYNLEGNFLSRCSLPEIEHASRPERSTRLVPAGSLSLKNFSQHCTACQLCVSNCPNNVLRPSTSLENFMQPEMSFERGYCRPECTNCSQVCPAGAIRPVTVEEKTSIQIGHAVVNLDNCVVNKDGVSCGNCARHCPANAIRMVRKNPDDKNSLRIPTVNEERCIGCGACENLCPARPFTAIHIEGHEVHRTI